MPRIPRTTALLAAGLLAACAPTVQVTPLGEAYAPRPGLEQVAVFSTQTPRCPYREIAIVTAYGSGLNPLDLDGVLAALRRRALEIGADALVGLHVVSGGGNPSRSGYSATAVRFEDPDCREGPAAGG